MHDALVEFIRSGGETETKDVNVAQYVRQLTLPDDNGDTPLHTQCQVVSVVIFLFLFYVSGVCSVLFPRFWLSLPVQSIAWKVSSPK